MQNPDYQVHHKTSEKVKANLLNKSRTILFIVQVISIVLSISCLTGCNTRILNNDPETLDLLKEIFTDVGYYYYDEEKEIYTVYDLQQSQIGYAFYAEGMGEFIAGGEVGIKIPGPMVILVGLESKDSIAGIYVVSHSETYYYWNILIMRDYFAQFKGLKIECAYFTEQNGKVDAISQATVSSGTILNIVREAAIEKAALIK